MKAGVIIFALLHSLFCCIQDTCAQQSPLSFESLSTEDGVSQGTINCIFQDHYGFMWFGTNDGLNKYDGHNITVYYNDLEDPYSISDNHISAITEDEEGSIWIGTLNGGLNKFNPQSNKFYRVISKIDSSDLFSGYVISSLHFDAPDILWVGTRNKGLNKYNLRSNEITRFLPVPDNSTDHRTNQVIDVFVDKQNRFWLATYDGVLYDFDRKNGIFLGYSVKRPKTKYPVEYISSIDQDKNGDLWLGTYGNGLEMFNPETREFTNYQSLLLPDKGDRTSNYIYDIVVRDSVVFCVTDGWGLAVFNIPSKLFNYYYHDGNNKNSINNNSLLSLFKDQDKNIWVGTNGRGINLLGPDTKNFMTYRYKSEDERGYNLVSVRGILKTESELWVTGYTGVNVYKGESNDFSYVFNHKNIFTIKRDPRDTNYFWVGDEGSGTYRLNKNTLELDPIPWKQEYEDGYIVSGRTYVIYPDGKYLWIGTNLYLHRMHLETGEIKYYKHEDNRPNSLAFGEIKAFLKSSDGTYWVGTVAGGLCHFDGNTDNFTRYSYDPNRKTSISNNTINAIYEDSRNNLWISTAGGLNLLFPGNDSFIRYTVADGLPNNYVYAALEDEMGYLWLSTNLGISRFNPDEETFSNYDINDGLQGNEFNQSAYFKADDGEIFFGGVNGITRFNPVQIQENQIPPKTVFTYFKSLIHAEEPVSFLTGSKEIEINYKEATFEIGFTALNYYKSKKNRYKYKLTSSNSSTGWIELNNTNKVDFFDLKPDIYELQVVGSNNDGVWSNEAAKLDIIIPPPLWRTWTFRITVVLFIALLVFIIVRFRIRQIYRQQIKLQELVKERTLELQEANQTKDKFLSIIGHDLKNPLNSIYGFSDLVNSEYEQLSDEDIREYLNTIHISAENLYKLTENLLGWARAQSKEFKMHPEYLNMNLLIEENIELMLASAKNKKISIVNQLDKNYTAWADYNMIKTVIRNLISNAIKFTPHGGKVWIDARQESRFVEFSVNDTGIGISRDKIGDIFKLSGEVKTIGTNNESGTGLGLILSKEFIDKNKGKIRIESEVGKGTSVRFKLPVSAPD